MHHIGFWRTMSEALLVSFGTQEEMEFVQMLLSEFDTQTNNISLKHTSYQDAGNFDPISYMYIGK